MEEEQEEISKKRQTNSCHNVSSRVGKGCVFLGERGLGDDIAE